MSEEEEAKAKTYIEGYLNGWHVGYEQGIVDTIKNLGIKEEDKKWKKKK